MKRLLIMLMGIYPAVLHAQTGTFTINGTLKTTKPLKVFLSYAQKNQVVLDSVDVKNGKFTFKGEVPGPANALLIADRLGTGSQQLYNNTDKLNVYLSGEKITITAGDSLQTAKISGSRINKDFQQYRDRMSAKEQEMTDLNMQMRLPDADKALLGSKFREALKIWKEMQLAYAKENPDSYFSLIAVMNVVDGQIDVDKIEPYYKALSANVRKTPNGIAFGKEIDATRATTLGAMAPDFTQNDVNDKPVKLSDFRGKYVLLDFWASWCVPCRKENPAVVKAFHDFKDKNFTVLSVSLDRAGHKQAWLDAIKQDHLEDWTHVSDLQFWDNSVAKLYGISSVPRNLLIDPQGKIIAVDLRGEGLLHKLGEVIR